MSEGWHQMADDVRRCETEDGAEKASAFSDDPENACYYPIQREFMFKKDKSQQFNARLNVSIDSSGRKSMVLQLGKWLVLKWSMLLFLDLWTELSFCRSLSLSSLRGGQCCLHTWVLSNCKVCIFRAPGSPFCRRGGKAQRDYCSMCEVVLEVCRRGRM